jgi:hypothetical protein
MIKIFKNLLFNTLNQEKSEQELIQAIKDANKDLRVSIHSWDNNKPFKNMYFQCYHTIDKKDLKKGCKDILNKEFLTFKEGLHYLCKELEISIYKKRFKFA